jgi:hypothetical protein
MKHIQILLMLLALTASARAQVPDSLSFQGVLLDSSGRPVPDGNYDLLFKMYKGANTVWRQSQSGVPITNGQFNVYLRGSEVWPLDTVAFDVPIDLGIAINRGKEITPRTPLSSAPFALGTRGFSGVRSQRFSDASYNIRAGWEANSVANDIVGATISGGGRRYGDSEYPNIVSGDYGTVGGGYDNQSAKLGTVGGGAENETGPWSTVGGGSKNRAVGSYATIAGGSTGYASGDYSTIAGGFQNSAKGQYSFAAGRNAHAEYVGSFVWNDSFHTSLTSTARDQFLIWAGGGVGIGTASPGGHDLAIVGNTASGLDGSTLRVENLNAGLAIAAHFETNGTDAAVVISQDGTGAHIKTFDNGNLRFQVSDAGNVTADGTISGGGADVAESFAVEGDRAAYEPGDVLVISARLNRSVVVSSDPYSTSVVGVYASRPGVLLTRDGFDEDMSDKVPLAVIGVVPTKVSAENGSISRGDLLVTSKTPGHAMKAKSVVLDGIEIYPPGTILGKALEPFGGPGTGLIEVLINTQ